MRDRVDWTQEVKTQSSLRRVRSPVFGPSYRVRQERSRGPCLLRALSIYRGLCGHLGTVRTTTCTNWNSWGRQLRAPVLARLVQTNCSGTIRPGPLSSRALSERAPDNTVGTAGGRTSGGRIHPLELTTTGRTMRPGQAASPRRRAKLCCDASACFSLYHFTCSTNEPRPSTASNCQRLLRFISANARGIPSRDFLKTFTSHPLTGSSRGAELTHESGVVAIALPRCGDSAGIASVNRR